MVTICIQTDLGSHGAHTVRGASTSYKKHSYYLLSQVTCGDHVKWITDEKSKKDRSVSKGATMSIEI